MQSIEAIISLMVFTLIVSYMLTGVSQVPAIDDSLYRYQLTNDVWRVLYLKGDFYDFDWDSASANNTRDDLEIIRSQTTLCAYLGGIRATSCPGLSADVQIGSFTKIMIVDGMPSNVTLTVAKHIG